MLMVLNAIVKGAYGGWEFNLMADTGCAERSLLTQDLVVNSYFQIMAETIWTQQWLRQA